MERKKTKGGNVINIVNKILSKFLYYERIKGKFGGL